MRPLAFLALAFVLATPTAAAALDVNRVTALFHDIDSLTLEVELLYTGSDAAGVRGYLDADHDGEVTQAEVDAYVSTFLESGSDPLARVLLDGDRGGPERSTEARFRDALGSASSTEALVLASRYETTFPAGAGTGRAVTVDAGERPVLAVHMEAPAGFVWTEATGVSSTAISEDGRLLSGLRRLAEPFSARLGVAPAPSGATDAGASDERSHTSSETSPAWSGSTEADAGPAEGADEEWSAVDEGAADAGASAAQDVAKDSGGAHATGTDDASGGATAQTPAPGALAALAVLGIAAWFARRP